MEFPNGRIGRSESVRAGQPGRFMWICELLPHVARRAQLLFPRNERTDARWTVPEERQRRFSYFAISDTPEVCRELDWFLSRYPDVHLNEADRGHLTAQSKHQQELEVWVAESLAPDYVPPKATLALPARPYQEYAADRARRMGALLLADDLGVGKTVSALAAINAPEYFPAVVVTMTALPAQWEREVKRFMPHATPHILKSGPLYDLSKVGGTPEAPTYPDVIITSYSKLVKWEPKLKEFAKSIVFDEVQELRRGISSQKGEAAAALAAVTSLRLGLSATPVYNMGGEIWNLLDILKPGFLGTAAEFTREWCKSSSYYLTNVPSKTEVREPEILGSYLSSSGYFLRRTKKQVGRELPPLTRVLHYIDCDDKPLRAVEGKAGELARLILAGGPSKAERQEAYQAGGRLDNLIRQATGIAKAPHVATFVKLILESEERVVLFGWHRAVYDLWLTLLKDYKPVLYTGSETAAKKQQSVEAFKRDSRVLIMSLRAGLGLDGLQDYVRTSVFGELDWSPGVHGQCEGRIDRDGQREAMTSYYLCAEDGSDPIVLDSLGLKRAQAEAIRNPSGEKDNSLQGGRANVRRLAEKYYKGHWAEPYMVKERNDA